MKELRESLHEEIQTEFAYLKGVNFEDEGYKDAIDGVTKLMDRAIEIEKIDNDLYEKSLNRENEMKDRLVKNGIAIAGIVVPTGLAVWGTLKTLKFEEVGTVTTAIGRNFINKLIPKK